MEPAKVDLRERTKDFALSVEIGETKRCVDLHRIVMRYDVRHEFGD